MNVYTDVDTPTLNVDIYKPVHIIKNLPLEIECIHAYGERFIRLQLGTD